MKALPWILMLVLLFGCEGRSPSQGERQIQEAKDSAAIAEIVREMDILREMGVDTGVLKRPRNEDAVFYSTGDTVKVSVRMNFDSLRYIQIPKTYLDLVGIAQFGMYAPYYEVEVRKDGRLKFNDVIQASDFDSLADSSLQTYGILGFPEIRLTGDSVELGFSYSIPLSDVGVAVHRRYQVK